MAEQIGSANGGEITAIAGTPTPHLSTSNDGSFQGLFPPNFPPEFETLPDPGQAAMGAIGDVSYGGPSHGNSPGPSPADGVSTDVYDVSPEEQLQSLQPWQGGVEV